MHNVVAAFCLRSRIALFYLTTIDRHFLFVPSPYYRSHSVPAAHTSGGMAGGYDKLYLSGKMCTQSYMNRASASVSELRSYSISFQFLYLNFFFCFIVSLQILLLCVTLSSGSAQLSYRLHPDLLSTLFLSTLSRC